MFLRWTGVVFGDKKNIMKNKVFYIAILIVSISLTLYSCYTNDPFTRKNLRRIACDSLQHDTIITVNKVKIVDDKIYSLFDSIIDIKNTCVYKNENVWFKVFISQHDSNRTYIYLTGYQHDERCRKSSILDLDIQGILRYRDCLFVFSTDAKDSTTMCTTKFYTQSSEIDSMKIPFVNKTLFTAYLKEAHFYHEMNIWYDFLYDGQKYIPHNKNCHCIRYFPIFYRKKKNDTILSIANKFNVSPDMILYLNRFQNPSDSLKKKIQIQ